MKTRARKKVDATFNMSSMTDIVFLLLIFFIVLSRFVAPYALEIDFPKVTSHQKTVKTEIVVEITKDYQYAVNGKTMSLDGVYQELKALAKNKPFPSVILMADGSISMEKGMEVIGEAKEMGYEKIVIRTEPK